MIDAGGVLRVPDCRWQPGFIDYERRARLAEQHRKLPANTRLEVRVAQGECEIRLVEAPAVPPRPALVDVPIPETVSRYHKVARAFRDSKSRHEVSRESLMRAVRSVHAIAVEAERRGWTPQVIEHQEDRYGNTSWSPAQHGHFQLEAGDRTFGIRVSEEKVPLRGVWEGEVQRYRNTDPSSYWWGDRTAAAFWFNVPLASVTVKAECTTGVFKKRPQQIFVTAKDDSWELVIGNGSSFKRERGYRGAGKEAELVETLR